MTTEELTTKILDGSYTQTQALKRLRALKDLGIAKLFGKQETKDEILVEQDSWFASLDKNFFRPFTKDNVYKLFEDAEKAIKDIKPLMIYLAVEIPEVEIAKIGQYLRQTYGNNFLMEIKIDPSLIAGTAFVWNGIYKDYSLRQKITDNRQAILSTLKGYIKH